MSQEQASPAESPQNPPAVPAGSGPVPSDGELSLSHLRSLITRLAAFRSVVLERRQFEQAAPGNKLSRRRQGRKRGADHRKNAEVTVPTGEWVWQLDPAGMLCVRSDDAQALLDSLNESMKVLLAPHLDRAVKSCEDLATSGRLSPDAVDALIRKLEWRDSLQSPLFRRAPSELCPAGEVSICPAAPDSLRVSFTGPEAKDAATKMGYDANKVLSQYADPIQRVWQQRWYTALGLGKG